MTIKRLARRGRAQDAEWYRVRGMPEPVDHTGRLHWLHLRWLLAAHDAQQEIEPFRQDAEEREGVAARDLFHAAGVDLGPAHREVVDRLWWWFHTGVPSSEQDLARMRDACAREHGAHWDALAPEQQTIVWEIAGGARPLSLVDLAKAAHRKPNKDFLSRYVTPLVRAGILRKAGKGPNTRYALACVPVGSPDDVSGLLTDT